ncbi:MAG TPA: DUF1330 domain-containing protein [Beijerinckiaceae bacterium]|jgi:uncharacterized protein (DUF1330 family)|nr:DUF1330 domain-containing protein [Beijerinckiaceae bacterium]
MVAFVFTERLELWDHSFRDDYRALAAPSTAAFGGKYITVSHNAVLLEGQRIPDMLSLIEFPTLAAAREWHASAEYQAAVRIRNRGSRDRLLLFEASVPDYAVAAGAV